MADWQKIFNSLQEMAVRKPVKEDIYGYSNFLERNKPIKKEKTTSLFLPEIAIEGTWPPQISTEWTVPIFSRKYKR